MTLRKRSVNRLFGQFACRTGWRQRSTRAFLAGFMLLMSGTVTTPSMAQLWQPGQPEFSGLIGAAGEYKPKYPGARDDELQPVPVFDLRWRNMVYLNSEDGFGVNVLQGPNFNAGLAADYRFGRTATESPDVIGLTPVGDTIELGAFAEAFFEYFKLRVEVDKGVDGHKGWLVSGEALGGVRFAGGASFLIGPTITYGSGNFMDSYFGVTAADAITSGLPAYDPGSGIYDYGLGFDLRIPLMANVMILGSGGLSTLADDAKTSPISLKNTTIRAQLGIAYRF